MEVGGRPESQLAALETGALPERSSDLLARIAVARVALDGVVVAAAGDDLATRRDAAGWRALDHLAHVAAWQRMIVAHLTDGDDHAIIGVTAERSAAMSLQEINDALHARFGGRGAEETMREYAAAHAATTALIERMPADAWRKPYWSDDPSGRTVMEKVCGDTYRHDLEHRRWIMALL